MAVVRRDHVERWVAAYEELWRTPGTARLGELFSAEVRYSPSPWSQPLVGLDELALLWDAERRGPEERFTMTSELVALDGDTAVVRVEVRYGEDPEDPAAGPWWRDLWVLRFSAGGRCVAFEEWPFSPGQPDGHGRPG